MTGALGNRVVVTFLICMIFLMLFPEVAHGVGALQDKTETESDRLEQEYEFVPDPEYGTLYYLDLGRQRCIDAKTSHDRGDSDRASSAGKEAHAMFTYAFSAEVSEVMQDVYERQLPWAHYCLGVLYRIGIGVDKDNLKARYHLTKSAEAGFDGAMLQLAAWEYEGADNLFFGSFERAAEWYRKAAENGDAEGAYALGVMYLRGEGVPQDYISAYMWTNIATSIDSLNRAEHVKGRDSIREVLTQQQIIDAQSLARECVARQFKDC